MNALPERRATGVDGRIRAIAACQHGVVTRSQLLDAGVPLHVIEYRVKTGRLHGLHRGVYRVGPLAAGREREMAAVLASGETAVLSHRSAAVMWRLLPGSTDAPVEVTVRGGFRAPGAHVHVHRSAILQDDETMVLEGIPITNAARTILDLAGCVGPRELEQALARAERNHLLEHHQLMDLVGRHSRRAGTRTLRALLAHAREPALTRSEAEARFLTLVRRARLLDPEANALVNGYEVDFLWRTRRLIVEVDGFAFHSSATAFEQDRGRDAALAAAGFRVIRFTWHQLTREPEVLLVHLAQALAAAAPAPPTAARPGL